MGMEFHFILALVRGAAGRIGSEGGQTMAEYGILIAVIAVIVVLAATLLGSDISRLFSSTDALRRLAHAGAKVNDGVLAGDVDDPPVGA